MGEYKYIGHFQNHKQHLHVVSLINKLRNWYQIPISLVIILATPQNALWLPILVKEIGI